MLNAPCPKCREPVLIGATRCSSCSYRLMRHEIRRAIWRTGIKLLIGVVAIGLVFLLIGQS